MVFDLLCAWRFLLASNLPLLSRSHRITFIYLYFPTPTSIAFNRGPIHTFPAPSRRTPSSPRQRDTVDTVAEMPVPFPTFEASKKLRKDERFLKCTVHAVESNNLQEVNEILLEVVHRSESQHFVLLSQSVTKEQLMDVEGRVQVHVATTAARMKEILLSVQLREGSTQSLFMIAGREFADGDGSS